MAGVNKEYVLGKGKVYFDAFAVGTLTLTGERYLGNTPELSTTSDQSTLDHFDSDGGVNVKDESVVIEDNMNGSFITDNISIANVGLAFGADPAATVVVAAVGIIENFPVVKKGRWYQLGTSAAMPNGARNVTNVVVKVLAATIPLLNNYAVDLALGRVYVEEAAPGIALADVLIVTYDVTGMTRNQVVGKGAQAAGAMRFISANPVGPQTDYFWPYVKLTLNGDMSLKGDEWQQLPFSMEVLKKDTVTERVYVERRVV